MNIRKYLLSTVVLVAVSLLATAARSAENEHPVVTTEQLRTMMDEKKFDPSQFSPEAIKLDPH